MKKLFVLLLIFSFLLSCKKEKEELPEPPMEPVLVLDQNKVETNMAGTWSGVIRETSGTTENMDVVIEALNPGEKVAEGKYFDPTFSCGFEWTYESFSEGKVTFREKTLKPNICFDQVPVEAFFLDDDFSVLRISISIQGYFFIGGLERQ